MSKMPALFVGHGSPMNAIEDNQYARTWRSIGERIPKPEVILSVSAHWFTKGTKIMNEENPKTMYDSSVKKTCFYAAILPCMRLIFKNIKKPCEFLIRKFLKCKSRTLANTLLTLMAPILKENQIFERTKPITGI